MSKLRARADRAITVTVEGETITLGFPTSDIRADVMHRVMSMPQDEDPQAPTVKFMELWDGICVDSLVATLRDPDDLDRDSVSRLLVSSRQEEDEDTAKELGNLFDAALSLCGVQLPDGKELDGTDHVGEADKKTGDRPT